jgi:hypothetical protein
MKAKVHAVQKLGIQQFYQALGLLLCFVILANRRFLYHFSMEPHPQICHNGSRLTTCLGGAV